MNLEGLKRVIINNGFSKSDKVQNQLDEYEDFNNASELPAAQVNISIPETTLTFSQAS